MSRRDAASEGGVLNPWTNAAGAGSIIVDNSATHKHAKCKEMASKAHPTCALFRPAAFGPIVAAGFGAAEQVEFVEDVSKMELHGGFADTQQLLA